LQPADVAPQILAPLYAALNTRPPTLGRLREALLDRLIDLTVDQARAQTEFYAALYDLGPNPELGLEGLSRLPQVSRPAVEAAGESIRSRYATYAFSSYTSGTTRGVPLTIDRSAQEQRYLAEFFRQYSREGAAEPRVVLVLATWHHGAQLQLPSKSIALPVYLSNETGFLQARALLTRTFRIDGRGAPVTAIAGTPNRLLQLTAYLTETLGGRFASDITLVQTTGRYLTRHSRMSLAQTWSADVHDRYSLTELFIGALKCNDCGFFHFDRFGVPEVVDHQGQRINEGRGRLLLTGLYPFTQMTPLIRYAPGDLAEVKPGCCASGETGYRLLGRGDDSVDVSDLLEAGSFLSAAEVYEAVDEIPDINRLPDPPSPALAARAPVPEWCYSVGGLPAFRLSREERKVVIDLELRYAPSAFPDQADSVIRAVVKGLERSIPWFPQVHGVGDVVVRPRAPEALPRTGRMRP
jgi:phenylacetate-coenzyme A ligase PaaK-like adenylate-forming protein